MENTTATTHSTTAPAILWSAEAYALIDDGTRRMLERYFDGEPAALTVALTQTDVIGGVIGHTIVGRDGSAAYFTAASSMAASLYANTKAEKIAAERSSK